MVADQAYFRQKLRRHNRFLHGWGVVCGLTVVAMPTPDAPWQVQVGAGYALGPYGDEIYVAEPLLLDLAYCGPHAATDPCEPGLPHNAISAIGREVYVAIKYAECVAQPVRVMPSGCGCEEIACEYSRIRDSFQIECLTDLPSSHQARLDPLLCKLRAKKLVVTCPPCPEEPWVVLARVVLPNRPQAAIGDDHIDNFVRRQIYSTAMLQQQLIACCCREKPQPAGDLVVEKRATKKQGASGNWHIRYTVAVANQSATPAHGAVVQDSIALADGVSALLEEMGQTVKDYISIDNAFGWTQQADELSFQAEIGDLEPQGRETLALAIVLDHARLAAALGDNMAGLVEANADLLCNVVVVTGEDGEYTATHVLKISEFYG